MTMEPLRRVLYVSSARLTPRHRCGLPLDGVVATTVQLDTVRMASVTTWPLGHTHPQGHDIAGCFSSIVGPRVPYLECQPTSVVFGTCVLRQSAQKRPLGGGNLVFEFGPGRLYEHPKRSPWRVDLTRGVRCRCRAGACATSATRRRLSACRRTRLASWAPRSAPASCRTSRCPLTASYHRSPPPSSSRSCLGRSCRCWPPSPRHRVVCLCRPAGPAGPDACRSVSVPRAVICMRCSSHPSVPLKIVLYRGLRPLPGSF